MHLRDVVAGLRKKVIPEAEDETAKHRNREQERSDPLLSRKQQSCRYPRQQRDNDDDVDVTKGR